MSSPRQVQRYLPPLLTIVQLSNGDLFAYPANSWRASETDIGCGDEGLERRRASPQGKEPREKVDYSAAMARA
jgi:hypothetical protein